MKNNSISSAFFVFAFFLFCHTAISQTININEYYSITLVYGAKYKRVVLKNDYKNRFEKFLNKYNKKNNTDYRRTCYYNPKCTGYTCSSDIEMYYLGGQRTLIGVKEGSYCDIYDFNNLNKHYFTDMFDVDGFVKSVYSNYKNDKIFEQIILNTFNRSSKTWEINETRNIDMWTYIGYKFPNIASEEVYCMRAPNYSDPNEYFRRFPNGKYREKMASYILNKPISFAAMSEMGRLYPPCAAQAEKRAIADAETYLHDAGIFADFKRNFPNSASIPRLEKKKQDLAEAKRKAEAEEAKRRSSSITSSSSNRNSNNSSSSNSGSSSSSKYEVLSGVKYCKVEVREHPNSSKSEIDPSFSYACSKSSYVEFEDADGRVERNTGNDLEDEFSCYKFPVTVRIYYERDSYCEGESENIYSITVRINKPGYYYRLDLDKH